MTQVNCQDDDCKYNEAGIYVKDPLSIVIGEYHECDDFECEEDEEQSSELSAQKYSYQALFHDK